MLIIKEQDVKWTVHSGHAKSWNVETQEWDEYYQYYSYVKGYLPNVSIVEKQPFIFHAKIEVMSVTRGRSAANFNVRDIESNTYFTLHLVELFKLMKMTTVQKGGIVEGYWQFAKKGANIGITYLGEQLENE